MKRLTVLALGLACITTSTFAGPAQESRALYQRFAAAQNDHDLGRVASLLLDSDRFLWVSDGMTIWGRAAAIDRMASFQQAEVWRVVPDLDRATPVEVSPDVAYLHLPLELVIGAAAQPDHLRFLVSALCVRTADGWRIAALFTTTEKPG